MNQKLNREKGIVLVALVITIIAMLILVVVSIRLATGGDLFKYAQNAAEKTNLATEVEKTVVNIIIEDYVLGGKLPSEYQEVEYLQSSGNQYIVTDITSYKNTYKYELNVRRIATTTTFVFAENPFVNDNNIGMFSYKDGYNCQNGAGTRKWISAEDSNFYKIIIENDGVTIDGSKTSWNPVPEFIVSTPLCLFGTGSDERMFVGYISSFKTYDTDGTTLLIDMIPCYRKSDNEAGMYDLVKGVFYTNAGTGTFIVGDDVN